MKEEVSQVVATIAQNPKTAWLTAMVTGASNWALAYLPPIVALVAQIAGLILVCVLIRYHWINTTKQKIEIEKMEKLKRELSALSDRKSDKQ